MIYFKSEANDKIGAGHLQRSLALARECRKIDIDSFFIFSDSPDSVIERVESEGFEIIRINKSDQHNASIYLDFLAPGSIIIYDTDDFRFYSGNLIEKLRENNISTACYTITDKYKISTDLLINPNIISQIHDYRTPTYTRKLLGPEYLIFREEFRHALFKKQTSDDSKNLIIMFGNADANHLTRYFINVIEEISFQFSEINIVAGVLNPDLDSIKEKIRNISNAKIKLHINTNNIQDIYTNTDLAITAAGMAMWEMALYRIPQMVMASSEREIQYVDYLSDLKYIAPLGTFSEKPSSSEMAKKIDKFISCGILQDLKLEEFKSVINPNGIYGIIQNIREVF